MLLSQWDFVRTLPGSFVSIRRNHHGRPACPFRDNLVPRSHCAASPEGSSVTRRRRPATVYATLISAVGLVPGTSSLPARLTYTGTQSNSTSPLALHCAGSSL